MKRLSPLPHRRIFIATLATLGILTVGCRSGHTRTQDENETPDFEASTPLPEGLVEVAEAIKTNQASLFARNVSYPLERPYPLSNVEDSASMVSYFPIMVDDSLRNVFADAQRRDWSSSGWRGWTLDAGQYLWYEDGVYLFPYLSKREKKLLEEAVSRDLATLPTSLRQDWKPYMCLNALSGEKLFRIDFNEKSNKYRLLEYNLPIKRQSHPETMMEGELTLEGTMQNRNFSFTSANGTTANFTPDPSDDEELVIEYTAKSGKPTGSLTVSPTNWMEHISK